MPNDFMAIPLNPKPEDKTVVLSRVQLDRDLYDALVEMAKQQERTPHQQVRWVLKDWHASHNRALSEIPERTD